MAASLTLGLGLASPARADGFLCPHVLPGVVPAYDFTTGGQYYAPPIPYGHYTKDYVDEAHKAIGCVTGPVHQCLGKCCGLLNGCKNCVAGLCQGGACGGGDGHGGCGGADGCSGNGAFAANGGNACVVPGCGGGLGCGHQAHGQPAVGTAVVGGGIAGVSGGEFIGSPVAGGKQLAPSGQVIANGGNHSGCGVPGCTIDFTHIHQGLGKGGSCGIDGCGVTHTHGGAGYGPGAGPGTGCGLCGGKGCQNCVGAGHGGAGTGCNFCGGQGCQKCLAAAHGAVAGLHGKLSALAGLLHPHPKVTYFVGPGGPVPLTPGYVPYIVATRSPRDYFAFPPRNPNDP
jgi:hypothetical protein